ncbi:MAG: VWA domain-containing protein [Planctomycetes bacterium]|nr:VWA domain-containing protein [Planctomycetota bacterium]
MTGELTLGFVRPALLLLLAALPFIGVIWWMYTRRGFRGAMVFGLRMLALAALIFALARPQTRVEVRQVGVLFTLDVSSSITDLDRDKAITYVRQKMGLTPAGDDAALIVFGDRPSLEVPFLGGPGGRRGEAAEVVPRLAALQSRLSRSQSDLAAALAFGEGAFPPGLARRIVLISDGNETRGDLLSAARALQSAGVRLDVLPVRYSSAEEVRVDGLRVPPGVRLNQPFALRVVVTALTSGRATLRLFENGVPVGQPLPVNLEEGANVYSFNRRLEQPGYYRYEVQVEAERDGNPANNVGRASLLAAGDPKLIVCAPDDWPDQIAPALEHEGLRVTRAKPGDLPSHPAAYIGCDCLVLSNVPAFNLTQPQQAAISDAVRELGMGLVVAGGDRSFGPGGYVGTPLAPLLPVDLDVRNRKHMPKGALVIVLHSIEFDTGNTWASRICKTALRSLQPDDDAGIVYYDHMGGEKWLFELKRVGDRLDQFRLIDGAYVGDMPSFHDCFVKAWGALKPNDAAVKHVVVISDGDPQVPAQSLLDDMVAGQVTVSTVCINPHGPSGDVAMKRLAQDGAGRFYSVQMGDDLNRLPALILKEAATLRRAAVVEKDFGPLLLLPGSSMLRGLETRMPQLKGYVVTSPRDGAETILGVETEEKDQIDPLLATWQIGLGRCTAFTSDGATRWAANWVPWGGFKPFWRQVARGTMTDLEGGALPLTLEVSGSRLRVVAEAQDDAGRPLTDVKLEGVVLGEGVESLPLDLKQHAPGRYSAQLDGLDQGHYLVRVTSEHGGKRSLTLGVASVDFSTEHRALRSNESLLAEAARLTGGRVLGAEDDAFSHDFSATLSSRELWPWLLGLACLFAVFDLVARRLDLRLPAFARRAPKVKTTAAKAEQATAAPMPAVKEAEIPQAPASAEAPKAANKDSLEEMLKAKQRAEDRRKWKS